MSVSVARACMVLLVVLLVVEVGGSARAYTFASPYGEGCHEQLTIGALRTIREHANAAPLPTSHADRDWIDDLPFELPSDVRDVGAASLIAGVRYNDLKGAGSLEPSDLAHVHGDPNAQHEHCLRGPGDDGPLGTRDALRACRTYILERFELAVRDGFSASGQVDVDARTRLDISLDFRGSVQVPMPTAYVQLGQALHALQDSFAHAARSEDGLRVRVLFNWVDYVQDRLEPTRDGPAHRAAMDRCRGLDDLRQGRFELAYEASGALLAAAFRRGASPDEKLQRAREVLDRYMGFESGCGADNGYCDAPELGYQVSSLGCSLVSGGPGPRVGGPGASALFIVGVTLLCWRRRWASRWAIGAWIGGAVVLSGARAEAQESDPRERTQAATVEAVANTSPFALRAAVSGSIDELGAAFAVGGRYRLRSGWLVGLDAEWNPWASLETGRVQPGTANLYATVVYRTPVSDSLALRITGHAGVSRLLFDMYGAPSGSVGPYLGLSLLALDVSLSRSLVLVLEPADVAVVAPQIAGIPYIRRQYRATLGLELSL